MEEYKGLIDAFCNLNKSRKKAEIRDELQELLMFFQKLCKEKGVNDKMLLHLEMKKLNDENVSEEDFLNGIYAYIISLKENIGKYLN